MLDIIIVEPDSLSEAHERILTVKAEITDMSMQLQDPNKRKDKDWTRRIQYALRCKIKERTVLSGYIQKKRNESPVSNSSTDDDLDITSHLKTHSRLMGRLNNLFDAVQVHLEKDDDESFENLQKIVDSINAIKQARHT